MVETRHGLFRCIFAQAVAAGQDVLVSARPEDFTLSDKPPGDGLNALTGKIAHRVFLGEVVDYLVDTGDGEIRVRAKPEAGIPHRPGASHVGRLAAENAVALPSCIDRSAQKMAAKRASDSRTSRARRHVDPTRSDLMNNARVTGLRSIELGVPNLTQSVGFYSRVWGLEPVVSDGETIHLRAQRHRAPRRDAARAAERRACWACTSPPSTARRSMRCTPRAKASGVTVTAAPADLPKSAGGGYGFQFTTPGRPRPQHLRPTWRATRTPVNDRSVPNKLSHVVLNSAKIEQQTAFFIDTLGFRLSDTTDMMDFVRCCADHHSIAMARGNGPALNHMAYEVANIDGLMRGAGRMKKHGFNVEWGIGRHGPGDNVFGYFVEPNGFVVEYTTEVEQVDEATYLAHDADYWRAFPMRPVPLGHGRHAVQPLQGRRSAATCRSPIRKPASAAKRSWRRRWGGSSRSC